MGSYGTRRRMLKYQTGDLTGGFASALRLSQVESEGYRDRSGSEQWAVFWSYGQYESDHPCTKANIYTGQELTQHAWDAVPESVLRENRRTNPETYWNAVDDFRQPHYELHWDWISLAENLQLRNTPLPHHGRGLLRELQGGRGCRGVQPGPLVPGAL